MLYLENMSLTLLSGRKAYIMPHTQVLLIFCPLHVDSCFPIYCLKMECHFHAMDVIGLICGHFKQLQLTYRPEEVPADDTKLSSDEPEPPPSEDVAVPNVDINPPTPPTPPQNKMDTGDLLVVSQL